MWTRGRMRRRRHGGLDQYLRRADGICVLMGPGTSSSSLARLALPASTEFRELCAGAGPPREHDTVVLAVQDLVGLRHAIAGVARVGTARRVVVWIERPVCRIPTVRAQPGWPPLERMVASSSGDQFVLLEFRSAVPVRPVLLQVARAAAPAASLATSWPALGVERRAPARWPAADPATTVAAAPQLFGAMVDLPPDLLIVGPEVVPPEEIVRVPDPVLGRPRQVRVAEPELTWEQLAERSEAEGIEALSRCGPVSLGAVDDQLINPIGFDRDPVGRALVLTMLGGGRLGVMEVTGEVVVQLDADGSLSDSDMPRLRSVPGLEVDWMGGRGPQAYCRLLAALASTGTPLVTEHAPAWAEELLAPQLVRTMRAEVDLTDRLAREEHSVRLRRAALGAHGAVAWRRALAREHQLQQPLAARVSVLLATRRPEMLPFALRQVAKQRGVDFELVLATHGFSPSPEVLAAFAQACNAPVTTVEVESSVSLGEVLNRAAVRATGDFLMKMDDDDWYGPDFVVDLLMAQSYSRAQLIGCFPEFNFVQPLWVTTRRPEPSEVYVPFVAGGTMLLERGAFRSLGGFRHTAKHVDAGMLAAVTSSGGSVFRSHGLGYVLRRGVQGHTWDPGLGYFVTARRAPEQWRGFRPSSLLEHTPEDRPARTPDEVPTA